MSISRYTSITSDWTDDSRCNSGRERVLFHYFNPNGLYRAHRAMGETISQYVDAGILTTGWLLAYGSLNSYSTDRLVEMHGLKRVNRITLSTVLEMIQENVDRGYTRLGEFIMSDEPTANQKRDEAARKMLPDTHPHRDRHIERDAMNQDGDFADANLDSFCR